MRELYDTTGPGKYEGEGPLTRYVDETFTDYDDTADTRSGAFAGLIGKRILIEDSDGFVTLLKFRTPELARTLFTIQTQEWNR